MIRTALTALFAAVMLSACGGGPSPDERSVAPPTVAERLAALDALSLGWADAPATDTLPDRGTAAFKGHAGLIAQETGHAAAFLVGDVLLTADFGDLTVTGAIASLTDARSEEEVGDLTLGYGRIGLAGVTGIVEGALTLDGTEHSVTGEFSGLFLGSSAPALAALVDARLAAGGDTTGSLSGEIWAVRD